MTDPRPEILFVCVRNGGKSQMAAALMAHRAGDAVSVSSAGTEPGTGLNAQSAEAVAELGADMSQGHPKPIDPELLRRADRVVVLGSEACIEDSGELAGRLEIWETDEPSVRGIDGLERMRLIRDDIDARVRALLRQLTGAEEKRVASPLSGPRAGGDESTPPVVVIGAGPVGLAAAAHLLERGLTPLILEAGGQVGESIRRWGHIGLFSPWRFDIDEAAARLLADRGWQAPDPDVLPTGLELVEQYLEPLGRVLSSYLRMSTRVVAVSRVGMDRTRTSGRDETPFLVRVRCSDGGIEDLRACAVLDASGTFEHPNPLGQAGLPAPGEERARAKELICPALPDVLGADRERFAGKRALVVGAGHSAASTLLALAELARSEPETHIAWAIRGADARAVYGGEGQDELAARGDLGEQLRRLVEAGDVELRTSFLISGLDPHAQGLTVRGATPRGEEQIETDLLVAAAGFRPDLEMLRELRLDLDPAVEAPRQLGPMIDAEFHSCGSVPPHGQRVLAHPERDFYVVGMKSYGRAPTFLMATGYEQVRSIAASLAGDQTAADELHLELPETGVCSSDLAAAPADGVGGCC